jgi:hypothetical protein
MEPDPVRQFASKAARCKARAAFELSASAAAVWPRRPGVESARGHALEVAKTSWLSTRIALAEKFVVFAKGNIALAEKFVAFDKRRVALAEKFIAVAKRNVALADKLIAVAKRNVALAEKFVAFVNCNVALPENLVAFVNCNVALAEKLVAFCLDFLQIRKRPKTSHAPAIVAAWSLPLSTPSGKRLR